MKIIKDRKFVLSLVTASALLFAVMLNTSSATEVIMYKNVGCECCGGWADHLRKAGYTVQEHPQEDMDAVKNKYGVSEKLSSCHTA
ncbi:MAG: DUF411 domain-containing protein, partial [Ghiorsea sp.]